MKRYQEVRGRGRVRDRKEAARLIVLADSPRVPRMPLKARIGKAADTLAWSLSRTENIWRRRARHIESWEMDTLRALRAEPEKQR